MTRVPEGGLLAQRTTELVQRQLGAQAMRISQLEAENLLLRETISDIEGEADRQRLEKMAKVEVRPMARPGTVGEALSRELEREGALDG